MKKDKFVGISKVGEKGQIEYQKKQEICLILNQEILLLYFAIKSKV